MLEIRTLRKSDVEAAVDLILGGTLAPDAEDRTRLDAYWRAAESCRAHGGELFVADDSEVVGFCQLFILSHFQHTGGRVGEVETVHVRADRRSQGIGEFLMRTAEEYAWSAGCYRVQLTSNNVRRDAHRFYERLGYNASHVGFKKNAPSRKV